MVDAAHKEGKIMTIMMIALRRMIRVMMMKRIKRRRMRIMIKRE